MALLGGVLGPAGLHRVVGDVELVAVAHVLAEHQRETVDEVLHRRRGDVEDANAALLGEDELAVGRRGVLGRRFGLVIAHATSSATMSSTVVGSGGEDADGGAAAATCARSARSRYHGRRLIHAGAMLP